MNVKIASDMFLRFCAQEKYLSPHTLRAYAQDAAEFVSFMGANESIQLQALRFVTYAQYLRVDRSLAPATVKRRVAFLRAMYGWLKRKNLITVSPLDAVDLRIKLPMRLPRCLTGRELRLLIEATASVDETIRLVLLLLFTTGVRVSELAGIRLADIDLIGGAIRIFGKGARERQVFIANCTVGKLLANLLNSRRHCAASEAPLLVNRMGRQLKPSAIRAAVRKLERICVALNQEC